MATTNGLYGWSLTESPENERKGPVRDLRREAGLRPVPRHGYQFARHGRHETSVGHGPNLYTSFAEEPPATPRKPAKVAASTLAEEEKEITSEEEKVRSR